MAGLDIRAGFIKEFSANRKSNKGAWHKETFNPPFGTGTQVVVFVQTQTYNGQQTPGLRLKNVSNTGFEARMDEVVSSGSSSDGKHLAESVGWIAMGT